MYLHPQLRKGDPWRLVPALLRRRTSEERIDELHNVQRILLPVDGAGVFRAALRHVVELSRTLPIRVYVVNVQPPLHARDCPRAMRARWGDAHYRALAELQWAKGALSAEGIECETEMVFGDPAREIVRYAVTHGCDKIVMTRRPRGFWRALFAPSVTQQVAKRSPLPVTTVPPLTSGGQTEEPFRASGLKDLVQAHMEA